MSIAIIINPIAGARGRRAAVGDRVELARRVAAERGEAADVFVTEQRGHAHTLAQAARSGGARLIVAWGGDGTINEVASALTFGDVPLGIVPAGSGNGLARALGVPVDPAHALSAALRSAPRAIDVGELDHRLFVNVAGIGFDAHVATCFNAPDNVRRGLSGYVVLTIRELLRYAPSWYDIAIGGARVMRVRALLVVLANGTEFGNRIRIAPAARLDDGVLDLVVVEERSRLRTVCNLPRLAAGAVHRASIWSSRTVDHVRLESDAPMPFHIDGEPMLGGTRLDARVHPSALRVCV